MLIAERFGLFSYMDRIDRTTRTGIIPPSTIQIKETV
jgi:hypothetical protein